MKPLIFAGGILCATFVHASTMPGFSVQMLGTTRGFLSSIVADSKGTIYYTTTAGDIVRFTPAQSRVIAHVDTVAIGNSGLLGMALRDDDTAVVHYTTAGQVYDVISSIDLTTGAETIVHAFVCSQSAPEMGTSFEHHGGNPIVAADGSVFVGIGDFDWGYTAPLAEWNSGKIFRIAADGTVTQFARGFRNPFDVAWDARNERLIVPDNGDTNDDEINIIREGDYAGWPYHDGNVQPRYVFPTIVAPTGIVALSGNNPLLKRGYLLTAFVTRAVYYIRNIDAPVPLALVEKETGALVDVTESASGDIYVASGQAIYKLNMPVRGDCNGDGLINSADVTAINSGTSLACDFNDDGVVDSSDATALTTRLTTRTRAVRSH